MWKSFLLFVVAALSGAEHAIVFVHLGPLMPAHASTAIEQARLFNPDCPIYLVANEAALERFSHPAICPIRAESLAKSGAHEKFLRETHAVLAAGSIS